MPLLRNIAGVPRVGLIEENGADMMRMLPDENGGGGGYFYPVDGNPVNPEGAGGDGGYMPKEDVGPYYPVNPVDYDKDPVLPVQPVEPILPIYPDRAAPELPVANQVAVEERFLPGGLFTDGVNWPGLITVGGLVLAMTGLHPFKKVNTGLLFAGALAVLYFELGQSAKKTVQPVTE